MDRKELTDWAVAIPFSIAFLASLILGIPLLLPASNSVEQKLAPPLQSIDHASKSDEQRSNQAMEHVPVRIALTASGSFGRNKQFTVTAYVKAPTEGESVLLHLPDGLALANCSESLEKKVCGVKKCDYTMISWKVTGIEYGCQIISAELRANNQTIGITQYEAIIRAPCYFQP